jgi:hypothetical protein
MGGYYNDELHHRQHTGDVGNAVLADFRGGGKRPKWKAFRLPVVLSLFGILLMYVGPVPGLGMLLVVGGVMALPIIALAALNS